MRSRYARIIALTIGASLGSGCAAHRPVLYPSPQRAEVGSANEARDVAECEQLASTRTSPGRGNAIARDTAVGTGTGAAVGAVGGAIYGGAGRGAAAGAAGGAVAGVLHRIFQGCGPNDTYKNFVAACLADRGYRVIGWE